MTADRMAQAVTLIAKLYEIERDAREIDPRARWLLRQQRSRPIADALHAWLTEQRQKLAKADATAKAIDYAPINWRGRRRSLCWPMRLEPATALPMALGQQGSAGR